MADVSERAPTDPSLACPLDNKLLREAVNTPCCGTTYSEENIQNYLLERDFICPHCGKKIASLDELIVDEQTRFRVNDYIEKTIEESKKTSEDASANDTSVNVRVRSLFSKELRLSSFYSH
jgi:protein MPE1